MIKWVAVGDQSYTPSVDQTKLRNELQREEINEFVELSPTQLKMVCAFRGDLEYTVGEIGYFLESGTLLAVYSIPNTVLTYKSPSSSWIPRFTLDVSPLPTDSITVVIGSDNLNILIEPEMMSDALAFIRSQTVQIRQSHNQIKVNDQLLMSGALIEQLRGLLDESKAQLSESIALAESKATENIALIESQTSEMFDSVEMNNTQAHIQTQALLVKQANNNMKSNEAIRNLESN
uniref:Phage tail fiber protein n=1 Tax=Vibrio tasmaniensis TaxID=212663 RepID=A0A0H4A0N7_9VIBR|nr:Phage tail fiber protein [Vibrio tasmaniensis]